MVSREKEYSRFLSCAWVHADFTHLLVNLIVLYGFGEAMEGEFNAFYPGWGSIIYLLLFSVSVVGANVTTYLKHKNNPSYRSVGASGGVSGVLFAYILAFPTSQLYLYFLIPIPALVFGVLYTIYSLYMAKKNRDHVNHEAHITGALTGIIVAVLVRPQYLSEFLEKLGLT
jgi:membrane associated rhomboid family serine protease